MSDPFSAEVVLVGYLTESRRETCIVHACIELKCIRSPRPVNSPFSTTLAIQKVNFYLPCPRKNQSEHRPTNSETHKAMLQTIWADLSFGYKRIGRSRAIKMLSTLP